MAHNLVNVPIPPFNPTRPERNVISFSLFGEDERTIRTAIMNARAARFLYLGWTCHFYIDDRVPTPVVEALGAEGARMLKVSGLPTEPFGTFWRFLVADDPGVDRYIVRDADALLNIRECLAVREWLGSDRHFHVMRDHYDQPNSSRRACGAACAGRCHRSGHGHNVIWHPGTTCPDAPRTRSSCAIVCGRRSEPVC